MAKPDLTALSDDELSARRRAFGTILTIFAVLEIAAVVTFFMTREMAVIAAMTVLVATGLPTMIGMKAVKEELERRSARSD